MPGPIVSEIERLASVVLTGYELAQLEGADRETLRQCSELLDCLTRAEELAGQIRWT